MSLSIFGAAVFLIGFALLVFGDSLTMLIFVLLCSLMGGSAAIELTSLGSSSIAPAFLALGFLFLRCVSSETMLARLGRSLTANRYLLVFAAYGVVGAFLLPRIFAGAMEVTPLRPIVGRGAFAVVPIGFSSQNITVAVYLAGTLVAGLCGYACAQAKEAPQRIAGCAAWIAIVHGMLGLASVLLGGTVIGDMLNAFRNGHYAQLNQSYAGFIRMNGIMPEPALYAQYGFSWLVFVTELWLRGVRSRLTGRAAAFLGFCLIISTSTTAYVGLVVYALALAARMILCPGSIPPFRAMLLIALAFVGIIVILLIAAASPEFAALLAQAFGRNTSDKLTTESGLQRLFWAKQGIAAFWASYGLGVGPGSFRSSSLLTALLGSAGVIGFISMIGHMVRVFRPLARDTYIPTADIRAAAGEAASWAALMILMPAIVSAPSPDPGIVWALLAGFSLAWREREPVRVRMPEEGLRSTRRIKAAPGI
jgi:hypothetical protein